MFPAEMRCIINTQPIEVRGTRIGSGIPKIIVPIVGETREEILAEAAKITAAKPDVIEWRADFYEGVKNAAALKEMLAELRAAIGETPVIFTIRTSNEGGKLTVSDEEYAVLLEAVEELYGPLERKNHFLLDRGPYKLAATLDESISYEPYVLEGEFIDLFDPALPVLSCKEVAPGSQAFLYDLGKAPKAPAILAAASRAYDIHRTRHTFSYVCKGPAETVNVTRILLGHQPSEVLVDGISANDSSWYANSRTLFLRFPNDSDGMKVEIR